MLAAPNCLFLLLWWLVPESPRWLASQHQAARALRSVGVAARCNRRPPPAHHLMLAGDKPGQQGQEQGKIQSLKIMNRKSSLNKIDLVSIFDQQNNLLISCSFSPTLYYSTSHILLKHG